MYYTHVQHEDIVAKKNDKIHGDLCICRAKFSAGSFENYEFKRNVFVSSPLKTYSLKLALRRLYVFWKLKILPNKYSQYFERKKLNR